MGTRATYEFVRENFRICYYIHWDGYLEGAASYLLDAVTNPSKGGLAESFIRSNELVEFTPGHNAHGDTEFSYIINEVDGSLIARAKKWEERSWKHIYVGTIQDFISKYSKTVVRKINHSYKTKKMLEADLTTAKRELKDYKKKFPSHSGNISGLEDSIKRIKELIDFFNDIKDVA